MVCAVILACGFALVMTKRKGLPAAFTNSMVSATAHRSLGEG